MEKVKAFVIKHQLWFKLAAIALLVCIIFTPYTSIILPVANETYHFSIFYYLTTNSNLSPYIALFSISIGICIITVFIIVLLFLSILKKNNKPFLSISLTSFGVLFILYLISLFLSIYTWGSYTYEAPSIPHIAFYLLLLLSVFVSFIAYYCYKEWRIKQPRTQIRSKLKKTEQTIAELEKRIEELENRKDGE
mgnify:CR=1 FL=1